MKSPKTHLTRVGLALLLLSSCFAFSQSTPGGVYSPSYWIANENDANNRLGTVGNYHSLNLLNLQAEMIEEEITLPQNYTAFFVLQPTTEPSALDFLQLGNIVVFGDHIQQGEDSFPLENTKGQPTIIAMQVQQPSHYGMQLGQNIQIVNMGLFDMAELVLFDRVLEREELRKVSSYLALKYSITITENDESAWRDYWRPSKSTSGNSSQDQKGRFYWDTQIDRLYKNRVIALGRSDREDFFQSQTITTSGEEVKIALGGFETLGTMPKVKMEDQSFLVFSEKKYAQTSNLECANAKTHPLEHWKFQLQDWSSETNELLISVAIDGEFDATDSLFLFDGEVIQYLPVISASTSQITYSVSLKELKGFRHYFFKRSHFKECEELEITTLDEELTVTLEEGDLGKKIEIQSLETGYTTLNPLEKNQFSQSLSQGQYIVSLVDGDGKYEKSNVVSIKPSVLQADVAGIKPQLEVFPNPVARGMEVSIRITNLPSEGDVNLLVVDSKGRRMYNKVLNYSPEILETLTLEMPGTYTVMAIQGESLYSQKLIVSAQ